MSKHPSQMTIGELMSLRANSSARRDKIVFRFYAPNGALWEVTPGLGGGWVRAYAGYDLDKRTLPRIVGPEFNGRRHGLNAP